jgi:lipopolysaccharide transport system ATP-binding protein
MSDVAIKVEGLGKKYLLHHQAGGRHRYVALRDLLAGKFKGLFNRKLKNENRKSVEEFWALKDVSFEIKPGEAVGIIGRNGAGKSTLLKILSRITEPTRGRIEIDGRVASLLEVGTGFHPELTGRENIFLNGAILGMHRTEIRKKLDEIVAFAEVEKFLDTPVKHFSSGMYMRLAFAVAAHLEPEILVVDEVLAVGDAQFQKKCLGKMQDISQQGGRTVLFVSHNLDSVLRLCNRAIWLDSGCLRESGPPSQIINRYLQHRQTQNGSVDLTKPGRSSFMRGQAKFIEISSPSTLDGAAWSYPFGIPLTFDCLIAVGRRFEQLSFAFAVFTASGFELASAHVRVSSLQNPIEPARYHVNITVNGLRLAPGSYTLNLGLRSEGGDEDFVGGAAYFDVVTNEAAAGAFADLIIASTIPETDITLKRIEIQ